MWVRVCYSGSRVTHVVFLRAKARGPMSTREAHISYLDGRDGNVRVSIHVRTAYSLSDVNAWQSGFSNGVSPSMITTATDYERRHGLHLVRQSIVCGLGVFANNQDP